MNTSGKFCPAIGTAGIISTRCQRPFLFSSGYEKLFQGLFRGGKKSWEGPGYSTIIRLPDSRSRNRGSAQWRNAETGLRLTQLLSIPYAISRRHIKF